LTLDDLHNPVGQEEIKIVPVIVGAGGDGVGLALLGAALVATAVFTGGATLSFGITGFSAGLGISAAVGNIGAGLLLFGVSQMLSPTPEIPQGPDTVQDPRKSFSFSGIQNTSRGGTPVPIVYGKTLTGSVVISAGIDTEQVQA
jgi:predicted phage tail protein